MKFLLLPFAALASASSASTDPLTAALNSVSFASALPGLSEAANYTTYNGPCYYLETEAVKCTA